MAQVKIYEMPGCISCRLKFTLGKAQPFGAYFDGGIPDKNYPAVYATSSIGQQIAIETSPMFKSGQIKLRKEKGVAPVFSEPKSVEVAQPAPSIETEVQEEFEALQSIKSYPEVTSLVDAIAILKSDYGVSATRLRGDASVLRVAEEKGVSFPNMKL